MVFHTAQKPLLRRYTGFEVTAYAMWAGTLFVLPWTGSLLRVLPRASGQGIVAAVFLGVAPSAVGFVLWAYAMARMDVGQVTTSLYRIAGHQDTCDEGSYSNSLQASQKRT